VLLLQLIVVVLAPVSVETPAFSVPLDTMTFDRSVWPAPTESVPLCVMQSASMTTRSAAEETSTVGVVEVPLLDAYPDIGVTWSTPVKETPL